MSNLTQIEKIIQNENDLAVRINNIYQLTEKQSEMRVLYKEQIKFLKMEYKNKKLTKRELQQKIVETKKIYQQYNDKIEIILDLNYSISIWEYDQSNILKQAINYSELKQEYLNKLAIVKADKAKQKEIKKEYQWFKKCLNPKYIALIAIVVTVLLVIISLLVNYLYYFKVANNGATFNFKDSNHLTAFVFICVDIILILGFLVFMVLKVTKRVFLDKKEGLFKTASIGFIGSFTDTIGIGSFAVVAAGLNATKSVKNVKNLPGTLNIGLTVPNLLAGTLFVSAIQVELATLISLVVAAMLGSFCAAKIVNKVNRKFIAIFVASCLTTAGILMIFTQFDLFATSRIRGLQGWKLVVGIIAFFIIGGLQSFGVGLYAPAIAIVSLLGMETIVAFPIMTCAGGFALPTTAWTFHRDNNYSPKVSYGLLIGGVFGTVAAFFIVFVGIQGGFGIKMDSFTYYLKWFAIAIMCYAAFMLLKKYLELRKEDNQAKKVDYSHNGAEGDFLNIFERKLVNVSDFKTFSQKNFEEKILINKINLLRWK
ncbi:MAG: sulfite exporter TauE/SafE family protein [Spiroplasma sp.]